MVGRQGWAVGVTKDSEIHPGGPERKSRFGGDAEANLGHRVRDAEVT